MNRRFWDYWVAGLIFAVFSSGTVWAINIFQENVIIYLKRSLPLWTWLLITLITAAVIFITIPWIYGRLIKWIYEEFGLRETP